nr:hypothetical protein Itr_chr01CG01480 [Ipomoea trifida]GLL16441.1 hypothetical protein Itr_chr01CG01510 [Ipomoea trifida]GMC48668.1 hypothetical protein Iba_chr01bCG0690 [Ipomoea batatas]GMC50857.1 hypothetical protein Iba_chr01cCG0800 [Ipomoea batatas]
MGRNQMEGRKYYSPERTFSGEKAIGERHADAQWVGDMRTSSPKSREKLAAKKKLLKEDPRWT